MNLQPIKGCRAATVGVFDGVHLGHELVLAQVRALASAQGLCPTVFSFDCHPLSVIKPDAHPKLLTTMAQRANLLVSSGMDEVVYLPFREIRTLTAAEFMRMLAQKYQVSVLVVGFNHRFGHDRLHSFEDYRRIGAEHGITVVRSDEYVEGSTPVSSSSIRRLISEGNITHANRLLGYDYTIAGKVVHGQNIGSSIGYPTANVKPFLDNQLLPAFGAYAALALLPDDTAVPAMVNIGTNPTVSGSDVTIEANLIDFTGDLYGSVISIALVERLRDERKFDSLDQLVAQLAIDRKNTLKIIK